MKPRRSIRAYSSTLIGDDILAALLRAVQAAPSGRNSQPWHCIVVRNEKIREALAKASHNQKWMVSAPLHLVFAADASVWGGEPIPFVSALSPELAVKESIRDTAIALTFCMLEAEALGLGSCCVAWFEQDEIRSLLNIPNTAFVVAVLTLGYPVGPQSPESDCLGTAFEGKGPRVPLRKPLEAFVHKEMW